MSATLLPCPFCGHDSPEFERTGDPGQSCIVICGNCGARHESSDEGAQSGSSWNDRTLPTGWKLVPVKPTIDMLSAMSGEWHPSRHDKARKQYAAMIAATPSAHTEAVRMSEAEIYKVLEPWAFKNLNAYPHCYDAARAVEQATAARLGVKWGDV